MAKIYIASKYSSKERLQPIKALLLNKGHTVYSSWLNTKYPGDTPLAALANADNHAEAKRDLDEVYACDTFILDTTDESTTGGREVELGYALDGNRKVSIVGPRRNVFHFLIKDCYETWEEQLNALEKTTRRD